VSDPDVTALSPPELLGDRHNISAFECGEPALDDWLRRRARANQISGASRNYVLAENDRVVGYYSIAAGAIAVSDAPGRVRRNMPDPIPMAVLGRLAIDRAWQRRGLGRLMLRDAALGTVNLVGHGVLAPVDRSE
jgi:GNAT superfamily N-acetyltransferase